MSNYLLSTYSRINLSFTHGKGAWLFTEEKFQYSDKTNKINANRLDSNRDFTDLVTGNLPGSINVSD